jgi:Glycosyl transferase family 11
MITTVLQGGMGNQMFQYAMGYAQARRLKTELVLSTARLANDEKRQYNLSLYDLKEKITSQIVTPLVKEEGLPYNQQIVNRIKDGDTILGYWQSEKYFAQYTNEIKSTFTSHPSSWDKDSKNVLYKIIEAGERSAFLGVRRTDYLNLLDYHGVMDGDYYQEALSIVAHKIGVRPEVFVFSDDPQWCREHLPEHFQVIEPRPTTKTVLGREDVDLSLMSVCRNAIIANSSFHWWGAWLGADKNVIAPKRWFTTLTEDSRDIVPDRWIKI